jgi:hypothetical protein
MTDFVVSTDLIVFGMSTFAGGQTFDGQVILDLDNTEALLVRKDGDGGDVFIIDTINDVVRLASNDTFLTFGASSDAQIHRGDGADIIEQRRGLNPQEWRIYERFVSFSDYDRLVFYIGGGPTLITAEIEAQSTVANQPIDLVIKSLWDGSSTGQVKLQTGSNILSLRGDGAGLIATPTGTYNLSGLNRYTGNDLRLGRLLTTAADAIIIDLADPSGLGDFEDSGAIVQIGRSRETPGGGQRAARWNHFVDVLDAIATSQYVFQRVDPFTVQTDDLFTISDAGLVSLPFAGSAFAIGSSTAQSGTIRLPNATFINFRDDNNSADVNVLGLDSDDEITIGQAAGVPAVRVLAPTFRVQSDTALIGLGAANDAQIHRGDGADILEQRRGANPQKWNIYDNFVSNSDYDRLGIYIGGGPPLKTAIIRAESTDATQGINILIESVSNAFGEGAVTLLAGTAGASLALQPSSSGSTAFFTGGGRVEFSNDIRLSGLIASVGLTETTPGVGLFMQIATVAAPGFRDSHSIDLQGVGGGASRSTWRTFVNIINQSADSIYTLQVDKPFAGGFADVMTIDDSSDVVIANSGLTLTGPLASFTATPEFPGGTPVVGLLLDTVPFTSVGQRDSDAIMQVGQAHDGATARSTRWQWFVEVTNNSGASTFHLQHSAAGQAFTDQLRVFTSNEFNIFNGILTFGENRDTRLRPDGPNELALVSSVSGTVPQQFNVYNNNMGSQFSSEYGRLDWISVPGTFVVGTAKGINAGSARPMALQTDELNALVIDTSQNVTITNDLVVSGAGPHAIAGAAFGAVQLLIGSTFTSDGASNIASGIFHTPSIVGAPGDTSALTGTTLTAGITTQTATESIANIAQLQVNEPFITDNLTGDITQASTVLITGAPTEGVSNDALRVADGRVFLGGQTIVDHDSSATFIVRKNNDGGDVLSVNTVSNVVVIDAALQVVGARGSSFGSIAPMTITSAFTINTTFTAGASGTSAHALDFFPAFTGAAGHTTALSLLSINGTITTQTAIESIANISTMVLNEPAITDNLTGSITDAQTLLIVDAPTEGDNNYALRVIAGATLLGGELEHAGSTLGFFGTTPATQPAAYTRNATIVEDRTLLASASATALNNNNVLAALIADLQSLGVIQ